jgi:hypothetical protein
MLERLHVHAFASELHSLHAKPETLFSGCLSAELDFSSCANDTLPRQRGADFLP